MYTAVEESARGKHDVHRARGPQHDPFPSTTAGLGIFFSLSRLIEPAASYEAKRNNAAALPKSNPRWGGKQTRQK